MTLPPLRLTSLALKDHISVLTSFEIKFLKKHHLLFALELGLLSFVGVLVAIITLIFTNEIFTKPKILSVYPSEIDNKATVASPVTVQFDHPVNQSEVKAEISPKVSGSWVFSPGNNLFFNKKLTFKPKVTLSTNTLYQVKIKNIRAIVGPTTSFNYEFQFRTQKLPEVSSIQNLKIGPGEPFIVNLDATNDFLAEFNFNFSPTVKFRQQLSIEKRQYILTPLETLKQGTTYQLTIAKTPIKYDLEHKKVLDREEPQPEKSLSFVTTPQPTILSVSSSGSSASTGPITVNFDKDMDKYSVANYLSLKPTTAYTLIWKDAKTLVINPKEKLPFNTSYELSFAKETKAQDGSFFETDFTSSFTTIGNVKVSQFTPSNGAKGIAIGSKIYVTFDQAVDQKSAQNHFSISPNVAGSFSWNQNMLIFTPSASLPYSSTYTVTVSSGIKSLNALDSITEFKTSFTTAALYEVVKLQVPVFKQRYSLSCEFANLRMVLAYRGISKSEEELIAETPFDNTPHSGDTWGDPALGFLGNYNGSYFGDGYGAYYPVIVNELAKYRPAEAHVGWNIKSLLSEVKAGNPVIIWSCLVCHNPRYWNTPDSRQIYAYEFYHMMTVVGYTGTIDNPQSIILNDSYSGRQISYSKSQFNSRWSIMNYTAVVVK